MLPVIMVIQICLYIFFNHFNYKFLTDYFEFLKTKILNMEKTIDSIKKIQEKKAKNGDQDGKVYEKLYDIS